MINNLFKCRWKFIRLSFLFLFSLVFQSSFSQVSEITIGNAQAHSTYMPIDRGNSSFLVWQGLYLAEEIGQSGYVNKLSFRIAGLESGSDVLKDIKIYLSLTSDSEIYNGNYNHAGYTLVYDGDLEINDKEGYANFNLTAPFYYVNSSNLLITIEHSSQHHSELPVDWVVSEYHNLSRYENSEEQLPEYLYENSYRPDIKLTLGCMFIYPLTDKSICSGKSIQIGLDSLVVGGGTHTYSWENTTGLNNTEISNPIASPTSDQDYFITVTGSDCDKSQNSNTMYLTVTSGTVDVKMGEKQEISLCSGIFTDSGGEGEEYRYDEDYILTVYPCDSLSKISIIFNAFDLVDSKNCETNWLKIFDGNSANCSLIGTFCRNDQIPEIISQHSSGALTFVFHSESSTANGWSANLSCVPRICDEIAGVASIITSGNDFITGEAFLNLSNSYGVFNNWQISNDGKVYSDIGDTVYLRVINERTTYYRAKVTYNDGEKCYSNAVIYVMGQIYYVNDASQDSDVFCKRIGNNRNDGLSPYSPVDKLSAIIGRYDLKAGDVVLIDVGVYDDDILFGTYDYGNTLKKVRIIGAGASGTLRKTEISSSYENLVRIERTKDIEFRDIYFNNLNSETSTIKIINSSGISFSKCIFESDGENLRIIGDSREEKYISDSNIFNYNLFNIKKTFGNNINVQYAVNNLVFNANIIQYGGGEETSEGNGVNLMSRENRCSPSNVVIDSNYFFGFSHAIYAYGDISNSPFNRISIKNNWFAHNLSAIDSKGIFISNADSSDITANNIRGNVSSIELEEISNMKVINNSISNSQYGISIKNKAVNIEIYNNSLYNSVNNISFSGLYNSSGLYVQNNIMYNTSRDGGNFCLSMYDCSNNGDTNLLDKCNNNLYFAPNRAGIANFGGNNSFSDLSEFKRFDHVIGENSKGDENSIEGNPEFLDAENGDLTLFETSIAIGRAASISSISNLLNQNQSSIGSFFRNAVPGNQNGSFAELKRKLDGGYHLFLSPYLSIKYTEEYNPTNPILKFKIYDKNRNIVMSETSSIFSNNLPVKYGDNYCSIKLYGCNHCDITSLINNEFYLLEVINDKNEKWFLRFKYNYIYSYITQQFLCLCAVNPQSAGFLNAFQTNINNH